MKARPKIAIIGAGIAGLSAAYHLLKNQAEVTLFEKNERIGGDVNSTQIHAWDGTVHSIDTGVTDFNASTFTGFKDFLDELKIPYQRINRSASFVGSEKPIPHFYVTDQGKFTYFKEFLQSTEYFEKEVQRFRSTANLVLLSNEYTESTTLKEFLDSQNYSEDFRNFFLYPRASAAFLMPNGPVTEFPIKNLVRFMKMHSMVGPHPSERSVIIGGMSSYLNLVREKIKEMGGVISAGNPVIHIERNEDGISVNLMAPVIRKSTFDYLVMAVKPDEVIPLLNQPNTEEKRTFQQLPSRKDRILIHTDASILPRSTRNWASFNLSIRNPETTFEPTITFWPNHLGSLNERIPNIFVTLNPQKEIRSAFLVKEWCAIHPLATADYCIHEKNLKALQGINSTWYCGSYTQAPFLHENALRSGVEAASSILMLHRSGSANLHSALSVNSGHYAGF